MRKYHYSLLTALVAPVPLLFGTPLVDIVSEDTEVLLSIRSVGDLCERWERHPLYTDLVLPIFSKFQLHDYESIPGIVEFMGFIKEEINPNLDEFFELFSGEVTFAYHNLSEMAPGQSEYPEFALMAEFNGSKAIFDAWINQWMEGESMISETFMGETLHFVHFEGDKLPDSGIGYALVDGIFVLAGPKERLRSGIRAIKEGQDTALSSMPAYKHARGNSELGGDVIFYLNLERLLSSPDANLRKASFELAAPFGITGESIADALRLDVLQAYSLDFELLEDGLLAKSALIYREKLGLLRLFAYGEGPLPRTGYVPRKVHSVTVGSFDLSAMMASLEKIVATAAPGVSAMQDLLLQGLEADIGVDLRRSVLENFAPGFSGFSNSVDSSLEETFSDYSGGLSVLRIRNKELLNTEILSGAIEAFKGVYPDKGHYIQTQQFQGETIYSFISTDDDFTPVLSCTITDSYLLVSSGKTGLFQLHQVLSAIQSGETNSYWPSPEVEKLFDRIARPGAVTRSYTDFKAILDDISDILGDMALEAHSTEETQLLSNLKKTLSELKFSGHLLSESNETPNGLFSRFLLLSKQLSE